MSLATLSKTATKLSTLASKIEVEEQLFEEEKETSAPSSALLYWEGQVACFEKQIATLNEELATKKDKTAKKLEALKETYEKECAKVAAALTEAESRTARSLLATEEKLQTARKGLLRQSSTTAEPADKRYRRLKAEQALAKKKDQENLEALYKQNQEKAARIEQEAAEKRKELERKEREEREMKLQEIERQRAAEKAEEEERNRRRTEEAKKRFAEERRAEEAKRAAPPPPSFSSLPTPTQSYGETKIVTSTRTRLPKKAALPLKRSVEPTVERRGQPPQRPSFEFGETLKEMCQMSASDYFYSDKYDGPCQTASEFQRIWNREYDLMEAWEAYHNPDE